MSGQPSSSRSDWQGKMALSHKEQSSPAPLGEPQTRSGSMRGKCPSSMRSRVTRTSSDSENCVSGMVPVSSSLIGAAMLGGAAVAVCALSNRGRSARSSLSRCDSCALLFTVTCTAPKNLVGWRLLKPRPAAAWLTPMVLLREGKTLEPASCDPSGEPGPLSV